VDDFNVITRRNYEVQKREDLNVF